MPTYDYACDLCGEKLEIFQSIRDERLTTCPSCLKEGLRRLIGTGAGIIFKGTGFYQTDYKNGGKTSEASEKSAEKAPASSDAGGSVSSGAAATAAPSTSAASSAPSPAKSNT
jgi:putative FmdB family regulatory protein